jgi:hypothetical protein
MIVIVLGSVLEFMHSIPSDNNENELCHGDTFWGLGFKLRYLYLHLFLSNLQCS